MRVAARAAVSGREKNGGDDGENGSQDREEGPKISRGNTPVRFFIMNLQGQGKSPHFYGLSEEDLYR